jgi:hypothetical protein
MISLNSQITILNLCILVIIDERIGKYKSIFSFQAF